LGIATDAGAQRDLRAAGCLPAGYVNGQKARFALMVVLVAALTEDDLRAVGPRIGGGQSNGRTSPSATKPGASYSKATSGGSTIST